MNVLIYYDTTVNTLTSW